MGSAGPGRRLDDAAEFVGKQLAGGKAQYAGDESMHTKHGRLGLVHSDILDIDYSTRD